MSAHSRAQPIQPPQKCMMCFQKYASKHTPIGSHLSDHVLLRTTQPEPITTPGRGLRRTAHCLRARTAATDHHGRLMWRSAALSAPPARAASNAPRHALLRPQAGPRAASARLPMAASATPRPRRPTPRSDRRHCSPRPPPGALPAAIGIYAARHVRRAAARLTATTSRATSRVGASARDRICHAAAEARAAARRLAPLLTMAAAGGAPGGYRHLCCAAHPTRRGTPSCDSLTLHQPRRSVGPWPHLRRRSRGARGRAPIAATDHHGRLLGRSAGLAASPTRAASDAPRHALLRPHGKPPAAAERRPEAAHMRVR